MIHTVLVNADHGRDLIPSDYKVTKFHEARKSLFFSISIFTSLNA